MCEEEGVVWQGRNGVEGVAGAGRETFCLRWSRSDSDMESSNGTENPNCFSLYSSDSDVFSDHSQAFDPPLSSCMAWSLSVMRVKVSRCE